MAVWYALVAMPVLPTLQFGTSGSAMDPSCATACACVSCSGGDACCCAPDVGGGSHDAVVHTAPDQNDDCPSWRPVDCAPKAAWMSGLKAPTIAPSVGVISETSTPTAHIAVIDEQAMPAEPIGVPVPPPRISA